MFGGGRGLDAFAISAYQPFTVLKRVFLCLYLNLNRT